MDGVSGLFQTALGFVVIVFVILVVWLIRTYGPALLERLDDIVEAKLTKEQRDSLYAAIKVGMRAASAHGYELSQFRQKAIEVATAYLKLLPLPIAISRELLELLIDAEEEKQKQKVQHIEGLLTPTIEVPHDQAG